MTKQPVHFSIDYIKRRSKVVFSYGWIFSPEHGTPQSVYLELIGDENTATAKIEAVELEFGLERDDVLQAFPGAQDPAKYSGWRTCSHVDSDHFTHVVLRVNWNDGTVWRSTPVLPSGDLPTRSRTNTYYQRAKLFQREFNRLVSLLMKGKFQYTLDKIKQRLVSAPRRHVTDSMNYVDIFKRVGASREWALIVDHDMGGGANKYRRRVVSKTLEMGLNVIVLKNNVTRLSETIEVWVGDRCDEYQIDSISGFFRALHGIRLAYIGYNNLVSYVDPISVVTEIIDLKHLTGAKLELFVHDYFMICPSQHLIDTRGVFCGIPSLEVCSRCLPTNRRSFVSLYRESTLPSWRGSWGSLISASDRVVAFSRSSLQLLQQVYGAEIIERKGVVEPHEVTMVPMARRSRLSAPLRRIGVVGHINFEKGAEVVARLGAHLSAQKLPIEIVVIGTLESRVAMDRVSVLGAYRGDLLDQLLSDHGIDMCLVPSICPETFSYVCEELIRLQIPIACFDIGAPPERVVQYSKGHVLKCSPSSSADVLLAELTDFFERLCDRG